MSTIKTGNSPQSIQDNRQVRESEPRQEQQTDRFETGNTTVNNPNITQSNVSTSLRPTGNQQINEANFLKNLLDETVQLSKYLGVNTANAKKLAERAQILLRDDAIADTSVSITIHSKTFLPHKGEDPEIFSEAIGMADYRDMRNFTHHLIYDAFLTNVLSMSDRIEKAKASANITKPVIICLRGNTASGKTYTLQHALPDKLQKLGILDEKGEPTGAINVDDIKYVLKEHDKQVMPQSVHDEVFESSLASTSQSSLESTSQSVHDEGSIISNRLIRNMIGLHKNLVIDSRFGKAKDIENLKKLIKQESPTQEYHVIVIDLDAELETSLQGVLSRTPDGTAPLVPYGPIEQGHKDNRSDRKKFADSAFINDYVLISRDRNNQTVVVATRLDGQTALDVHRGDLYDQITKPMKEKYYQNLKMTYKKEIDEKSQKS